MRELVCLCDNKTDELDLSLKKEKVDKGFEKDKARFYITKERDKSI